MREYNLLSDLHKDARGFRPGSDYCNYFDSCTEEQKAAIWDSLCEEMVAEQERENEEEKRAILRWELHIGNLIRLGAKTMRRAIQWDMDAENLGHYANDLGYYFYHHGIHSMAFTRQIAKKTGLRAS